MPTAIDGEARADMYISPSASPAHQRDAQRARDNTPEIADLPVMSANGIGLDESSLHLRDAHDDGDNLRLLRNGTTFSGIALRRTTASNGQSEKPQTSPRDAGSPGRVTREKSRGEETHALQQNGLSTVPPLAFRR